MRCIIDIEVNHLSHVTNLFVLWIEVVTSRRKYSGTCSSKNNEVDGFPKYGLILI